MLFDGAAMVGHLRIHDQGSRCSLHDENDTTTKQEKKRKPGKEEKVGQYVGLFRYLQRSSDKRQEGRCELQ